MLPQISSRVVYLTLALTTCCGVRLPLPFEAWVGLMNPDVLAAVFRGGLAAPTELPLEEEREAGILGIGFGIDLGAGLTGAGAFFTVATDTELFNELLELLNDVLEVDLSTLNELVRLGTARFGSMGVLGGTFISLVGTFFGITGSFVILGTGESHSTLHPDEAP